jgi:hypothetical protein
MGAQFRGIRRRFMTFKTLKYSAAVAGLAGALSLAGVTASSAGPHWGGYGHWGPGAAIGAGVAGLALGAAAAAANAQYYGYGPYGYGGGYYDYAPGAVVVDPGPAYYGYGYGYDNPWRGRRSCDRRDISGC